MLVKFVKNVKENYPTEFDQVRAGVQPDAGAFMDACVAAVLP